MYIPKRYGERKITKCPFCDNEATTENKQGFPVCSKHKNETVSDLKCLCGATLETMTGKFGVFFKCINCGNVNARKVLETNTVTPAPKQEKTFNIQHKTGTISKKKFVPHEVAVRSDDPNYFSD